MALVELRQVTKSFVSGSERLTILRSLSLTVMQGASVVISGESGSGKSTLLNIVGGLDHADEGHIVVNGINLADMDETALTSYRGRDIGFIFQSHYLLGDFNALENIMLPIYIAGGSKSTARDRGQQLLAAVNMEQRHNHFPYQLSGGERQRVAVARALVHDPKLILADEPTGNLDEENSRAVEDLLFRLVRERGATLILVTHDESIARRADIRMRLEQGILHAV